MPRISDSLLRYGVAILAVVVASLSTMLLSPVLQPAPFSLFFAAVMIAAWYGGLGPGLVATILSSLALDYFFLGTIYSLGMGLDDVVRLGVFGLVALFTSSLNAARYRAQEAQKQLIRELQAALANIKKLSGLLPICAACKRIRDDQGYWSEVEAYIRNHSEATFTHGICPECAKKLYPEYFQADLESEQSCPPA
jgi:K+-sensing histidine kinase KdpD